MTETNATAALVGATGGAGTTRLTVETAATLARAGRSVAVFEAAYATQGLARHVDGPLPTDVTDLAIDGGDPTDPPARLAEDAPGEVGVWPARAPFTRIAAAKTGDAAERLADAVEEAATAHDAVLVDVPPVAANQAVAAVTRADRVGVVTPAAARGVDALQRTRDRLADVGTVADLVVANRAGPDHPVAGADVAVPEHGETRPAAVPVSASDPDDALAPAVATLAENLFGVDLGLSFPDGGRFPKLL